MRKKFFSYNLDFFGFSASMLCALHCMAVPFMLTAGTVGGVVWLQNPLVEVLFISLSVFIASWSLIRSYVAQHQQFIALRIVLMGFLLILGSRFVALSWEPILAVLGGITIARAHWVNWRLCKAADACALKKN